MSISDNEDPIVIPGVGKSTKKDLRLLGINKTGDLKKRDPRELYDALSALTGKKQDRCVLYVYKCAVYYANGGRDPEKLKWWNWKDDQTEKNKRARRLKGSEIAEK